MGESDPHFLGAVDFGTVCPHLVISTPRAIVPAPSILRIHLGVHYGTAFQKSHQSPD